MAVKYIDLTATKYTNIFNCKTLQNLPKLGFWVRKYTICATLISVPAEKNSDYKKIIKKLHTKI
jgi:hypothetical protein